MSFKTLGYNLYTRPIKYTTYFARNYPSYFWSVVVGIGAPVGFAAYPYVREYLGYDNSRADFPPLNYPIPNRPRFPPKGFEDPPRGSLEPTWYRHVPPPPIREALEKSGVDWNSALVDLEARRDAMVLGNEWDVSLEDGKITWNKPSMATLEKRIETEQEFMDWGKGWRKGVVYLIWKVMGSPEGVFEYEGGQVDGKLVLRDLRREKREGEKFVEEGKKTEETKPEETK